MNMKVKQIVEYINTFADEAWAFDRDNSGLQIGDESMDVHKILLAVDPTEALVDEAIEKNCNMIITHHPLLFHPIKNITSRDYRAATIKKLLKNDIALYASHTCFDVSPFGINAFIAEQYNLQNISFLGDWSENFYNLELYVPCESTDILMQHLFEAGVGNIGFYKDCAYVLNGKGQFTPLDGAAPAIGELNIPEITDENKIEAILPRKKKNAVISAIMRYHPYETPVFHISEFCNANVGIGIGVIGDLSTEWSADAFIEFTKDIFHVDMLRISDNYKNRTIKRVGFSSGASTEYIPIAKSMGADVMITSECKSYDFEFAMNNEIILISLTHFISEHCFTEAMKRILLQNKEFRDQLQFLISEQTDSEVFL